MPRRNSRSCHSSAQNSRDLRTQSIPASLRCAWQSPDHDLRARGEHRDRGEGQRLEATTHEVTIHSYSHRLGHDETEPWGTGCVAPTEVDQSVAGRHSATTAHKAPIVVSPDEPVGFGQHEARLRGEFGASLATTRTQDGAAGTGAHSQAETVHLGAAPVVRLEGSLAHDLDLSRVRTPHGQLGRSQEAREVKVSRQAEVN
jgi:hypothetical protein